MNVFYLNENPTECAKEHCDKHVVKMIIEYAQLLSTAHRMLDGELYVDKTANNRRIKRWRLSNRHNEELLYKASHVNHPSAIWTRQSAENYKWLSQLFVALCDEYTYRYGKVHETDRKLRDAVQVLPTNIPVGTKTPPPPAMPDYCKLPDSVSSYKNYYIKEKSRFAKWTKRMIPEWFSNAVI